MTKFLESEDKNFSLFNYVNELNNEIEQVGGRRQATWQPGGALTGVWVAW